MEGGKFYVSLGHTVRPCLKKRTGRMAWQIQNLDLLCQICQTAALFVCLFIFYFVLSQVTGKKIVEGGF